MIADLPIADFRLRIADFDFSHRVRFQTRIGVRRAVQVKLLRSEFRSPQSEIGKSAIRNRKSAIERCATEIVTNSD